MAYAEQEPNGNWRCRYRLPDGSLGSKSGFTSPTGAENWGDEQEALMRRNLWIDPRDAETPFGEFAHEWFTARKPRLERGTAEKYRSVLANHLLPQWEAWPLIGIFNGYIEIEKWVSELHEDYADTTVATIFALFSTVMKAAVKARCIPASPCADVRVTSGDYATERLVASPVQVLRAAMRLYERLGLPGFMLGLMDAYTGCRWGELAGQQRYEYDAEQRAITIRQPLKEVNGTLYKGANPADQPTATTTAPVTVATDAGRRRPKPKKGRTKTPAGTRIVELPPSIAVFYEILLDSHRHPFVMCTPEGRPGRRSNFRQRHWRPVWDGTKPDKPYDADHMPPILPWFTFHEGRHTHSTWLIEDGIPEVARRARLGQKMKGMARIYDHVTPVMRRQILDVLEARWLGSVAAPTARERAQLVKWFPHLGPVLVDLGIAPAVSAISISSPFDH
jgi:integrase